MYWDGNIKISKVAGQGVTVQDSMLEISVLRFSSPYASESEYYLVVRPNYMEYEDERLMIQD